jgi:uncharacterized protein (TIGR02466 family)
MSFVAEQCVPLFADPLYISRIENVNFLDKYEDLLYKDKENNIGVKRELQWKSDDDLHQRVEWKELCDIILNEVNNVFDDYGVVRDNIVINNMWGQIGKTDNTHSVHTHPNSYFSGIIYIKASPMAGITSFHRSHVWGIEPEFNFRNELNSGSWSVIPEKGKMVIFPSWLKHAVQHGFEYNTDRVTLAFTVMPVANIKERTIKYNYTS